MQSLTKQQLRTFAGVYLETMNPDRAARALGSTDPMRILEQEEVQKQITKMRKLFLVTPEDIVRRMVQLAFGRANDCVRLALEENVDIGNLDLSLLSEIKRNDKGTVELRLVDRLRVLERLLTLDSGGNDEAAAFFRAMQAACGETQTLEEST